MPPTGALDPDRETARELLEAELARDGYHRPRSLVEQVRDWVSDLLERLLGVLPGSGGLSAVMLLALAVAVLLALLFVARGHLRRRAAAGPGAGAVLDTAALSAEDYRHRAARARLRADWDAVLLDSYRAITASAQERTLVPALPGLTADEVAAALVGALPGHEDRLPAAARDFDTVRYGGARAGRQRAESVARLEEDLRRTRPAGVGDTRALGALPDPGGTP